MVNKFIDASVSMSGLTAPQKLAAIKKVLMLKGLPPELMLLIVMAIVFSSSLTRSGRR